MSKKRSILLIISIIIIYIMYSNKYLLNIAFNYFTTPKDIVVTDETFNSLDSNKSLEDFLIQAEKKRQSYAVDIVKEEQITDNTEKTEKQNSTLKKEETPPKSNLEKPNNKIIPLEDIKALYMQDFVILETSFKNNINSLITSALSDYNSGNYSKKDIAKKYLNQGEILEKNSDEKFYILLEQMKQELKSNQHSLDLTNDIKTYYESYKNDEKNKLVEKGMSIVKKD